MSVQPLGLFPPPSGVDFGLSAVPITGGSWSRPRHRATKDYRCQVLLFSDVRAVLRCPRYSEMSALHPSSLARNTTKIRPVYHAKVLFVFSGPTPTIQIVIVTLKERIPESGQRTVRGASTGVRRSHFCFSAWLMSMSVVVWPARPEQGIFSPGVGRGWDV